MPLVSAVRAHFERSFGDTLMWMFGFVENRPKFLRPAFYGAFFIWALILFRGALIVLPIALPILFFTDRQLFWQLILVFLVLAPAGGFTGGLLYSLVSPIANPLGVVGAVVKFTFAAWGYLIVLVYAIMPVIDRKENVSFTNSGDWIFIGGFGLLMGIVLAVASHELNGPSDR